MFEGVDDIQLMERAQVDDMAAFAEIVRRHQAALVNFFRRWNATIEEAEDCAQETFVRLFSYRKHYRRMRGRFSGFLYMMAGHVRVDWSRRAARRRRLMTRLARAATTENGVADEGRSPDKRMDAQEALRNLSDKLREAVILSVYQGLAYSEIAEILRIPMGTAKSRIFLAFQQMREALADDNKL